MSYEFFRSRDVRARKAYRCEECDGPIAVGELHQYGAGKTEGVLMDQRLCLVCAAIIHEGFHCDALCWDEGFPMGEVRAVLRDELGVEDAVAWAANRREMRLANAAADAAAIKVKSARAKVLLEIHVERVRQVQGEGWSADHDDAVNAGGDLARAASAYALAGCGDLGGFEGEWPVRWSRRSPPDPRRALVVAGALIVAELERIDRLTCPACGEPISGGHAFGCPEVRA